MIKWLKRIVNNIKLWVYSLPFAMKAVGDVMTTSQKNEDGGPGIQQRKTSHSVWQDLIDRKETEAVKELRYQMYKIEEESMNYQYTGGGEATKIVESDEVKQSKRKKFTQYNRDEVYGVAELMQKEEISVDLPTRKIFHVTYSSTPKFKLENFAVKIQVDCRSEVVTTKFYFEQVFDRTTAPFVNALKNLHEAWKSFDSDNIKAINEFIKRNEMCSGMEELEFATYKASNNLPNGITYKFKGANFTDITMRDNQFVMTFTWHELNAGKLLSEKYENKTAKEKYDKKAKKENSTIFIGGFVTTDEKPQKRRKIKRKID